MAINLSFIDFIVPIAKIRDIYPGGWEKCLYDHKSGLGGHVYFDKHLFHTGAMSPIVINMLIERWAIIGFEATEVINGKFVWKDFCVVESLLNYSQYSCQWLKYNGNEKFAYLAGTEPGPIVGRRLYFEKRNTKAAKFKFKADRCRMYWTAFSIYQFRYFRTFTQRLHASLVHQQDWESTTGHTQP
jgi:hypothetical protein